MACRPLTKIPFVLILLAWLGGLGGTARAGGLTAAEAALLAQRENRATLRPITVGPSAERILLEHPSRPADPADPELPRLIAHLEHIARAQGGHGLAAVQAGIPVRLLLLRRRGGGFEAFLNPEVVEQPKERVPSWEHCLSVPWGYRHIERAPWLRVRYRTPAGEVRDERLWDDEAAVFQQELDHLDGVLLSRGLARDDFIPEAEMAALMADLDRACRGRGAAECRALSRQRWEDRRRRKTAPLHRAPDSPP